MKKVFALLLSLALMATMFTGCGLFSSGDGEGDNTSTGAITITDSVTHEDPADLEFETRYALTCGKDAPSYVESFKADYGADFIEQIVVIYASADDKVLKEYDYYVFATSEDANKYYEGSQAELRGGSVDGTVVCEAMDEELINQIIDMNVQYGSMSENTATAYVQFQKEVNEMNYVK